jgi:hypothetical protein
MSELARASGPASLERICSEVSSKCGSLRAASRLLPGLPARESDEMLRLMIEEALRLAKSLEAHRQNSFPRLSSLGAETQQESA